MSRSQKVVTADELQETLDGKAYRWGSIELAHGGIGHNSVFGITDEDRADPHLLRSFCTSPPIPWSTFSCLRTGDIKLSEADATAAEENLNRLASSSNGSISGGTNAASIQNSIAESVKSIGRFLEEHCPELCTKKEDATCRGATFLMLGVVTGNMDLTRRCLELGANPNNMSFMSDPEVTVNQMQHGYSPMFISVISGKLEVMSLLHHFGGSVHVYDRWGRTPLHAAVALEDAEVVQWLLSKGAPRCIGNFVNLLLDAPAEHEDVTLPNPALHPRPTLPPSEVQKQEEKEQEQEEVEEKEKEEEKKEVKDIKEKEVMEKKVEPIPCHCHSGRPKGYCGCVDDMFIRWSYDRLNSWWQSDTNFSALAAAHAAASRNRSSVG
ncbi:uncharacterized protein TM35_000421600 [Trypanosoma theileri]|uniref:Uncharacterized protein n=1 Tax=Trypanosoma theileri TaxID=67003 RepID=A0A1X0NIX5_9TRYP|nr:uncharacterized protein TM35_000421600 [Trypanosoma theileri]ORC84702.1 hypothetical protein TM35_000421600 [Trypanosoma theileri]